MKPSLSNTSLTALAISTIQVSLSNLTSFLVLNQLIDKIAHSLATIHSGDTIHGDLTTSNMMLKPQISLERQLSGIKKMSPHELVASGNIGELVSLTQFWQVLSIWSTSAWAKCRPRRRTKLSTSMCLNERLLALIQAQRHFLNVFLRAIGIGPTTGIR